LRIEIPILPKKWLKIIFYAIKTYPVAGASLSGNLCPFLMQSSTKLEFKAHLKTGLFRKHSWILSLKRVLKMQLRYILLQACAQILWSYVGSISKRFISRFSGAKWSRMKRGKMKLSFVFFENFYYLFHSRFSCALLIFHLISCLASLRFKKKRHFWERWRTARYKRLGQASQRIRNILRKRVDNVSPTSRLKWRVFSSKWKIRSVLKKVNDLKSVFR